MSIQRTNYLLVLPTGKLTLGYNSLSMQTDDDHEFKYISIIAHGYSPSRLFVEMGYNRNPNFKRGYLIWLDPIFS